MAVRFKAQVCSHLNVGIVGLNPVEVIDVRLLCFGSGHCDEPITRPEESYQMCVCV